MAALPFALVGGIWLLYLRLTGVSLVDCPACKRGRMVCIETLLPRPPSQGPPDGRA